MLNFWIRAGLLKKRPRVQLSAEPTLRALNELKRECYLRNDIRKRSDFLVFWHQVDKTYTPSDTIHRKIRQVVKQPTHCSHTAGDVVTCVVISLQEGQEGEAFIIHQLINCKHTTLNIVAKVHFLF